MNRSSTIPLAIYLLLLAAELMAVFFGSAEAEFFVKPLLMPALAWYYFKIEPNLRAQSSKLFILALFFSWIGDTSLMFVPSSPADMQLMGIPKHPLLFLAGLGGFLITHLLYIKVFTDLPGKDPGYLSRRPSHPAIIALLIYFAGLMMLVFPALPGEMTIPVLVYSATIAGMVFTAWNRRGNTSEISWKETLAGALMFLFSDSLIALGKFTFPDWHTHFAVMLLYTLGQLYITRGFAARYHS
jgi:uncharacterized membrane protein YhhN